MSRASLRTWYLRALADSDPVTAQYYFQKMQSYDEALRLYGIEAAKATLPKTRVRRKAGRLAMQKAYLDALKAGDTEKADALAAKIATRDRSGMQDDVNAEPPTEPQWAGTPHSELRMGDVRFPRGEGLPKSVTDEFKRILGCLR